MMKFIPYEKMSKKRRREENAKKRATWGEINPVTRVPERPDAYNRNKEKMKSLRRMDDYGAGIFQMK